MTYEQAAKYLSSSPGTMGHACAKVVIDRVRELELAVEHERKCADAARWDELQAVKRYIGKMMHHAESHRAESPTASIAAEFCALLIQHLEAKRHRQP